jgi:hypothetical protein
MYFENYGRKKLSTIFLWNLHSSNVRVIDTITDVTSWAEVYMTEFHTSSDNAHSNPRIDRQELSPNITL